MTSPPVTRRAILLVEDNEDVRESLSSLLELYGFHVVGAGDGQEALDLLHDGARPACILLDLMMPRVDGYQFRARQMRDASIADIPTIVLSGDTKLPSKVAELQVNDWLQKPVDPQELLAVIERRTAAPLPS